ncbi:unnamed protein product [Tenebrio molitor]|nr:unnamed protein product [Tenebrio molitor]
METSIINLKNINLIQGGPNQLNANCVSLNILLLLMLWK